MLFTIEARAYDILGYAAHNFWVLRDESGEFLGQIHGLATDCSLRIKPIGTIQDRLKFYHFGSRALLLGLDPKINKNYIIQGQKSQVVFTSTPAEVISRWDHAVNSLPLLNSMEIAYTPLAVIGFSHINSNTAYALVGELMGLPIPRFPGYWQPGLRNAMKLLTSSDLDIMRYCG